MPAIRTELLDTLKSIPPLLLCTEDYESQSNPSGAYNYSVQIIDPKNPWPPLWFVNYPCAERAILTDAHVLDNGNLSFYFRDPSYFFKIPKQKGDGAMLEGYIQLDGNFDFKDFFAAFFLGPHCYQIMPDGRRIYIKRIDRKMDLSNITFKGTKLGKSVTIGEEMIQIMDNQNNITFSWELLDHLSFDDLYYDEYAAIISHSEKLDRFNFSRINSLSVDPFDGNLLISIDGINACLKINIKNGEIMWRLGGKKSDFPLDNASMFFLPRDFGRIPSGPFKGSYKLFSTGNEKHIYNESMIFNLDEKNMTAKVIDRYRPDRDFNCLFNGNFEIYNDHSWLVNFADKGPSPEIPSFSSIDSSDKVSANFYAPKTVTTPNVTGKNIPEIKRPVISCEKKDGKILLTAHGHFGYYQWSTGETTSTITVSDTGTYYVVGEKGIGGSPSEFLHIHDLHEYTCPAPVSYEDSKPMVKKPSPEEPANPDDLIIDLPFYHGIPLKGEVKLDLENEYYLIQPFPAK